MRKSGIFLKAPTDCAIDPLLHLLVPCAVLAAVPIQTGWESFKGLFRAEASAPLNVGQALCLVPFIYCLVAAPAVIVERLVKSREPDSLLDRELLARMKRCRTVSEWAFSIRPIFAFRANLLTPPRTTVIPEKRVRVEEHLADDIAGDLERFRPGPVYLYAHLMTPRLDAVLGRDYQLAFRDGDDCLFVRNDLIARLRVPAPPGHTSPGAGEPGVVKGSGHE